MGQRRHSTGCIKYLSPCCLNETPSWSSLLLASARPSRGCYGHLLNEPEWKLPFSPSLPLSVCHPVFQTKKSGLGRHFGHEMSVWHIQAHMKNQVRVLEMTICKSEGRFRKKPSCQHLELRHPVLKGQEVKFSLLPWLDKWNLLKQPQVD